MIVHSRASSNPGIGGGFRASSSKSDTLTSDTTTPSPIVGGNWGYKSSRARSPSMELIKGHRQVGQLHPAEHGDPAWLQRQPLRYTKRPSAPEPERLVANGKIKYGQYSHLSRDSFLLFARECRKLCQKQRRRRAWSSVAILGFDLNMVWGDFDPTCHLPRVTWRC